MTEWKQYEFDVEMSCSGCSNAVEKVLKKREDVKSVSIYLDKQKVFVVSKSPSDAIEESIKKTGKKVTYVGETADPGST